MRVLLSQFVCEVASYLPSNCFMRGSVGGISWYASCWCRGWVGLLDKVRLGSGLLGKRVDWSGY